MPYSADVRYFTTKPASSAECAVSLTTKLASETVREGETTEIEVTVENLDEKDGQNMALAIVGLPGGLEPRHEQLKELVESGTMNAYEVIGRNVVVYFTTLAPGRVVSFRIDTVAAVPGKYAGPASQAYLYYADEHRHWVDGLTVTITPR
ncbi:MAG: alpha-2-macroglobulin family protein [Planctomycetota bacterium]